MFGLIKKILIGVIASVAINASSQTKCVSLLNQKFENLMNTVKNYITFHLRLN